MGVAPTRWVTTTEVAHEHGLEVGSFDSGFAQLSEKLAAAFQATALNRPAVLLVKTPGAQHEEKAWAERFPAAVKFLFPKPSVESARENKQ